MIENQPATPVLTTEPVRPTEIDYAHADVSERYDDIYQTFSPDEVVDATWQDGAYQFNCKNGLALRVQIISGGIIRLRYSPDGHFSKDFSYATDPDFRPEKVVATLDENDSEYILVCEKLQVVVQKLGMSVKFYDPDDRTLCEDFAGFSAHRTIMKGWAEMKISKKCHRREAFFGLGDKACGTNLRGKKFQNWCSDAYAFGREYDPMYRAIPFYYALNQGVAYGIFFDNSFKTHFDFDSEETGVTQFWAEGGEVNYCFLAGPTLLEVSKNYARLTGRHELPPIWSLGYQQCRWSYYPEKRVREVAETFRKHQIPCDAIYLDIDYMDGYRVFTWNKNYFPDPKTMISDLQKLGFQTVLMIDPGVKDDPHFHVRREGLEKNHFLKTVDGDLAKAPVWPGFCLFPDFTKAETRGWWGDLYENLVQNEPVRPGQPGGGVAGFWNDMNEPAVFHVHHKTLPDHVLHDHDGHPCSHRKAHNIYGMQMNRASWDGLRKLQPEKRPFLLSRASFSGGQRFSAIWTGDNCSNWEHLQIANIQCQRLAVSGFSFCGTDIGGFCGDLEPELYLRWMQLAVFHPLMRVHSMGQHTAGDTALALDEDALATDATLDLEILDAVHQQNLDAGHSNLENETPAENQEFSKNENPKNENQPPETIAEKINAILQPPTSIEREPWAFGEKWLALNKQAIELRYALLPVIYTAMWKNTVDGTPALRHLIFEDASDPKLTEIERDFMFGDHVLVSPVIQPKVQRQMVYLPTRPTGPSGREGNWFYFWSGQQCHGDTAVTVLPEQIPFFVREGAVLPVYPIRQWTGERPVDELTLYVYFKNGLEISELYEDAGEGYDYRTGNFSLKKYATAGNPSKFSLRQTASGNWKPTYQKVKILMIGLPFFAKSCVADGVAMPIKEIRLRERSIYTLSVGADFGEIEWVGNV